MLSVQLKGFAKLAANIIGLPSRTEAVLVRVMTKIAGELERVAKNQHLSGQDLDARSGNLKRAVFGRVGNLAGGWITARVGVDLKKAAYGRVHEFGGTIRPKNAAHLTIPLDAAQTGKGVAKFTARDVMDNPQAYGYVGTFFLRRGSGLVLMGDPSKGVDASAVPLFSLVKQVTVRPVGFLSGTVEEVQPRAQEMLSREVKKDFQKVLDGD